MLIELYIFAFISIVYGIFITLAIIGFNKLKRSFKKNKITEPSFVSIVISARNESSNITECLEQIIKQNFPKELFEIIVVDDASIDNTYEIAHELLLKSNISFEIIRQNKHHGKKINLALAIKISKGEIIITTDADICYRHPDWLLTISDYFGSYSPNMLVMPVDYQSQSGLLEKFQIIENIALTGITAGYSGLKKSFMCNGANLAFKKAVFEASNGYHSHLHLSSGEDVFLMEDIKKINASSVHYVLRRELIVKTKPLHSWKDFFHQRVRWASKAKNNTNNLNLFAGFIIIGANLLFLALFVAILKKSVIIPYLSIFVITKFVFDFLLLFLASDFLGRIKSIWWIIPFECLYWIYALIIGTTSLFYKPYWKEKKIN
ncbi:MAG: glycosyltransferase [Burkholderiales bacterium]|nr:glycosyltransferase [Bacteroidia bacterium]